MEQQNLVKNTLDQIPQVNNNAKRIVGLVKEGGRITGYQLSDNSIVEKAAGSQHGKTGANCRCRHRTPRRYGISQVHPRWQ